MRRSSSRGKFAFHQHPMSLFRRPKRRSSGWKWRSKRLEIPRDFIRWRWTGAGKSGVSLALNNHAEVDAKRRSGRRAITASRWGIKSFWNGCGTMVQSRVTRSFQSRHGLRGVRAGEVPNPGPRVGGFEQVRFYPYDILPCFGPLAFDFQKCQEP